MKFDDYVYIVKHAKFDKDKFALPQSIEVLKECKSFNEAKEYLENECKQYPLEELYIQVQSSIRRDKNE